MTIVKSFRVIRNAAGCTLCGDAIESKSRHDFVVCKCGNLFVDGGLDYIRRGVDEALKNGLPTFIDLSQTYEIEVDYG